MRAARRASAVIGKLVGGVLWFPVTYLLTQIATRQWLLAVATSVLGLAAVASLVWARFTPEGRKVLAVDLATDWPGSAALLLAFVALCTGAFAVLSSRLYESGIGAIEDGPLRGGDVAEAAYTNYLWHFADTIPIIKVPKTLNWELQHPFTDSTHGALLLVYTVLVVLPFVYAATQVVKRWTSDPASVDGDEG